MAGGRAFFAHTMADQRPLIAVFRGGYSGESVISHQSAGRMLGAIDAGRYDPVYVSVTRDRWTCEAPDGTALGLDRGELRVLRNGRRDRVDAALIAIHGAPGEDGKLQGFLDMLGIPYQTGGVGTMAISFGKFATTALLREWGHTVAPAVFLVSPTSLSPEAIVQRVGLPCFVKPEESGSSLGISKVRSVDGLPAALEKAFAESDAVMVEGAVQGRELTCGVLIDGQGARALPVCEIRTSHEFFDYQAKYHAQDTQELIPAPLPDEVTRLVQERSVAIACALRCRGMVRIDHIWTGTALSTIEVNTTPGFSGASIYPKMLEVAGIGVPAAINGLIEGMLQP